MITNGRVTNRVIGISLFARSVFADEVFGQTTPQGGQKARPDPIVSDPIVFHRFPIVADTVADDPIVAEGQALLFASGGFNLPCVTQNARPDPRTCVCQIDWSALCN